MKSLSLICAEGHSVDGSSNVLSLFGIMEELTAQALPIILQKLILVSLVEKEEGDPNKSRALIHITLDKEKLIDIPIDIDFSDRLRARTIVEIGGLLIPHPGNLTLSLLVEDNKLSTWSILVRRDPQMQTRAAG